MGELKDKTRILATHAIDFLDVCDSIIMLDKGEVVFKGPYEEVKNNEYLQKLVAIHKQHKEESELPQTDYSTHEEAASSSSDESGKPQA